MRVFKKKILPISLFFLSLGIGLGCSTLEAKADVVVKDKKPIVLKSTTFKTNNVIKVPDRSEERRKREEARSKASRGGASASRYADRTVVSGSGSSIVNYAYNQMGKPYVWGATGPNSFDCSGFTQYVFRKAGIYLNRTTFEQVKQGRSVSKSNLRAGDLIFFNTYSSISHVGIYIGNGKFIHASSGSGRVTISSLNSSYYVPRYAGARRLVN